MKITSPVFSQNQEIPQKYTSFGPNINPPLQFQDFPKKTKSFVLWIEDADAAPRPWIHWLVFNIPGTTEKLDEGSVPDSGTEGLANNKTFGYEGPNPKYFAGTHHYYFKVFALDSILNIPAESDLEFVRKAMQGHVLDQAELLGLCISR